jgi:hypothetical protein
MIEPPPPARRLRRGAWPCVFAALVVALGGAWSRVGAAQAAEPPPPVVAPVAAPSPPSAAPHAAATPVAPAPPAAPAGSATMALDRAAAAYEYGDMNQVVEAARPIAEGTLPATTDQRVDALMLLGIGLFLTNRSQGAEIAFVELMKLRPTATMNPTTTRPEVVAFFQDLRHRHDDEIRRDRRSQKSPGWNLLPPVGQFKNGDTGRGVVLLAVGVAAATGAALTYHWLSVNRMPGDTYRNSSEAVSMRNFNYACVGLFVVTYLVGVADGFLRYDHDPEPRPSLAAALGRDGALLSLAF